jgi:hypothetical protein
MKINIHILILFLFLPVIAYCLPYEFPDSLKSDETFSTLDTNSKIVSVKSDSVSIIKSLDYNVTRVANGLIDADGELNESIWKSLPKLTDFYEVDPGDNTKADLETVAMMCMDEDYLYIGVICYEKDVTKIRKTFSARDNMFNDDFVDVMFDTYNEGKQALEFVINPYGIQGDLIWTYPGNESSNYDAVWYSGAHIYKDRWTAEYKIPFKSIRFPDKPGAVWGFHIIRNHPRENRTQYSFVPIPRNSPTLFTSHGNLSGISNVKGGKNLEILPYMLTSQNGYIKDPSDANSDFHNDKTRGEFGVNLKYGISSTLTADVTYNPDFSQVESDASQINVNNNFALYFNEKRPFFLEGANIFDSPMNLVYTRTLYNPLLAAKITGKIGKTDIGFLSAMDKNSAFIIPFEDYSDYLLTNRKAFSNLLRIKHTIKNETYVGFIFTDREVNKDGSNYFNVDGYNRVYGVDANVKIADNYSLQMQAVKYDSKEITYPEYSNSNHFDDNKYTSALDGEKFSGIGAYVNLARSAKHWNFNLSYNMVPPSARRDLGYLNRNDYKHLEMYNNYVFYNDNSFFLRIQPQLDTYVRHTYDGRLKELVVYPGVWMKLKGQIQLNFNLLLVNNELYFDKYVEGARRASLNVNINTFDRFTFGFYANGGKYIVRQDNPYTGFGAEGQFWFTFKPVNNLTLDLNYDYFELSKNYQGEKLYAGYILRNVLSWQLTKSLSARLITEYNGFSTSFYLNPLVSFRPNPFTIFYFGFTHSYQDLPQLNATPVNDISKFVLTERQFFLKMQYLFRI